MTRDASWGHSAHWHTDTKVPWYEINDGLPQRRVIVLLHGLVARVLDFVARGLLFRNDPVRRVPQPRDAAQESALLQSVLLQKHRCALVVLQVLDRTA